MGRSRPVVSLHWLCRPYPPFLPGVTMPPIRILIADDHPIVRDGIMVLFAPEGDIEVIGTVGTGDELWEMVRSDGHTVDVLILDLTMPAFPRPVRQIARLHEAAPSTAILVLSAHADRDVVQAVMDAGALGYINKAALSASLLDGVRQVNGGQEYFSSDIESLLRSQPVRDRSAVNVRQQIERLTERERDVFRLVGSGMNTQQVAEQLDISLTTVQTHVRNAYSKLQIHSRAEAAALAQRCEQWGIDL